MCHYLQFKCFSIYIYNYITNISYQIVHLLSFYTLAIISTAMFICATTFQWMLFITIVASAAIATPVFNL